MGWCFVRIVMDPVNSGKHSDKHICSYKSNTARFSFGRLSEYSVLCPTLHFQNSKKLCSIYGSFFVVVCFVFPKSILVLDLMGTKTKVQSLTRRKGSQVEHQSQ